MVQIVFFYVNLKKEQELIFTKNNFLNKNASFYENSQKHFQIEDFKIFTNNILKNTHSLIKSCKSSTKFFYKKNEHLNSIDNWRVLAFYSITFTVLLLIIVFQRFWLIKSYDFFKRKLGFGLRSETERNWYFY